MQDTYLGSERDRRCNQGGAIEPAQRSYSYSGHGACGTAEYYSTATVLLLYMPTWMNICSCNTHVPWVLIICQHIL